MRWSEEKDIKRGIAKISGDDPVFMIPGAEPGDEQREMRLRF
jgi:hypothetical protein